MNAATWTAKGVTYRQCPECKGAGEFCVEHESRNPQLETSRRCGDCAGAGHVVVRFDVLASLAAERRHLAALMRGGRNELLVQNARRHYQRVKARAMAPVSLPTHHYADPLFREAKRDCDAAVARFFDKRRMFDAIFRKAA